MFYEDNFRIFNKLFPDLMNCLSDEKDKEYSSVVSLVETRSGYPTIQIQKDGNLMFIHSKYNPIQEVEAIKKKYVQAIEEHDHLFFYGLGLGYHIEQILRDYPNKSCTIFEPNPDVFKLFLESRPLNGFPLNQVQFLLFENDQLSTKDFLYGYHFQQTSDYQLVILPSYERIFHDKLDQFKKTRNEVLNIIRSSSKATNVFAKRWLLNSLFNLPTTIQTPNIIDTKKDVFSGKPIIIAAAGPSLYEDIELLRHIKNNGLAYIFSVGSANKALHSQGITPDAVMTYDPQPHNIEVFRDLINSGRNDIPMIFGTSVGFETIESYNGPKFHMVNSVDHVSNYYLGQKDKQPDVYDSFTISIIAIQLAQSLEASCILLAGQNLAFKENRFYAKGIHYWNWEGEVREGKEYKNALTVKDVEGKLIETNAILNNMRLAMEQHIQQSLKIPIYNTSKGGAAIEGAPFVPLEELLSTTLTKSVVKPNWWEVPQIADRDEMVIKQMNNLERSIELMYKIFRNMYSILDKVKIQQVEKNKNINRIIKLFSKLDSEYKQFLATDYYQIILKTIMEDEFNLLEKELKNSFRESNLDKKLDIVVQSYDKFLSVAKKVFEEMNVHIKKAVHPNLRRQLNLGWKLYKHDDGAFAFIGNWDKQSLEFTDLSLEKQNNRKLTYKICTTTAEKGNKILFDFHGTKLKIYASKHPLNASNVQIKIDGKNYNFTTKAREMDKTFSADKQHVVFEIADLANERHHVQIELATNEVFAFEGVEIDSNGRLYHPDEVDNVEELEVGKRIRCHYKATYNIAGTFRGLGDENGEFIPPESSAKPDGDFYFIMVDEEDGHKKMIADRNVQHSISWDSLHEKGFIFGTGIKLKDCQGIIRSLKGGVAFRDKDGNKTLEDQGFGAWPIDNEWDEYMVNYKNLIDSSILDFNWYISDGRQTWCQETPLNNLKHPYLGEVLESPVVLNRVFRTRLHNGKGFSFNQKNQCNTIRGFRPLIEIFK